jgi:hypothetical protein
MSVEGDHSEEAGSSTQFGSKDGSKMYDEEARDENDPQVGV